ncbi:MAG: type-F conjugative transfer system secretin TraK [Proteobacteria bacterium]|nr:type-F conjugative transfer system secretin TraK [Pseudomonadota bacterium]
MLKNLVNRSLLKIPCTLAVLYPMFLFSIPAQAQSFVLEDNSKVSAEISAKELTRISVIGDRITLVRGSEGAYQISNDTAQGAVFIKPIVDQSTTHKICPIKKNKEKKQQKIQCQKLKEKNNIHRLKSFYLFISTEQGRHYVLNLTPRSTRHADVLALKPQELEKEVAKTWETSERYTQTLIRLVEVVLQQKTPSGYDHTVLKKPKAFNFGRYFDLKLADHYTGAHLSVEIYQLTNHSKEIQTLAEEDLYQSGDRAIYLQAATLAPHQTTQLIKVTSHV